MPQVWMTYDEIATLLGCDAQQVRAEVASRLLDRRKSRDGMTRVKLDPLWLAKFYEAIRSVDDRLDRAIGDLKMVHAEMKRGLERPEAGSATG